MTQFDGPSSEHRRDDETATAGPAEPIGSGGVTPAGTPARTGLSRWRTPLLAVAAVVVVGAATAIIVQQRGDDSARTVTEAGAQVHAGTAAGSQADAGTDASGVNSPESTVTDYGIALDLFAAHPASWGGAFVDGDVLVIKYVNQSAGDAQKQLASAGASSAIRLEKSDVSMSDFDRAQQALTVLAKKRGDFASWGPDYQTSSIVLQVTGDPPDLAQQLGVIDNVPITVITNARRGTT